jgi:hypothetical protein
MYIPKYVRYVLAVCYVCCMHTKSMSTSASQSVWTKQAHDSWFDSSKDINLDLLNFIYRPKTLFGMVLKKFLL